MRYIHEATEINKISLSAETSTITMPITKIHAREIFDSRGNPTVEVDLTTDLGMFPTYM